LKQEENIERLKKLYTAMLDYAIGSPLVSSLLFFKFLQQDFFPWSRWKQFLHCKQQTDQLIYSEIHSRRKQDTSSKEDILSLLINASDELNQPVSDVELRDELMTLLFAGHESTASALAWALYWIFTLPDVKSKVMRELNSLDSAIQIAEPGSLPYLSAICQETLRIYPPGLVAIARVVKEPLKLGNYYFQPGTVLVPCIYLVHHREELYPQPKDFKPERFLERKFSVPEYLPFGGGHRRCIGMFFAQLDMKLILATIISQVPLKIMANKSVKPVRRGPAMAPPVGLKAVVLW
jgi:cytochrome P450